jgi:hypothetical protein
MIRIHRERFDRRKGPHGGTFLSHWGAEEEVYIENDFQNLTALHASNISCDVTPPPPLRHTHTHTQRWLIWTDCWINVDPISTTYYR